MYQSVFGSCQEYKTCLTALHSRVKFGAETKHGLYRAVSKVGLGIFVPVKLTLNASVNQERLDNFMTLSILEAMFMRA